MAKTKKTESSAAMDRRSTAKKDRRESTDRRQKSEPVKVERRKIERRAKVSRRRQIDPTTCERDYTDEELLFMHALDDYKRTSGRMFPTCSEILEVLKGLGYRQSTEAAGEASVEGAVAVATEPTDSDEEQADA